MNIRRLFSYLVVAALAVLLWTTWNKEHPEKPAAASSSAVSATASNSDYAPQTYAPQQQAAGDHVVAISPTPSADATDQVVTVKTDTLNVNISLKGGDIVSTSLLKYKNSYSNATPVQILSNNPLDIYVAQSGLTNTNSAGKTTTIQYSALHKQYVLASGANSMVVELQGKSDNGLIVTKRYIFSRNSYAIQLAYAIKNSSNTIWTGSLYTQLVRKKLKTEHHLFYARSYDGAAVSSPERLYYKLTYEDMAKQDFSTVNPGGWVAMQQQYFLSAWIPANKQQENQFYSRAASTESIYTVGFLTSAFSIAPQATGTVAATLYVGPEIEKSLSALAPGLGRTVDYGWLWWISIAIFWVMSVIHHLVGNWGWTIIITTILIKFLLYPLSATSFRSMAKMRELQPKMQQLKEKFADDRQAMSRATMELYRKEKINPLGGCLPMLIQIPIFIALYYVIIESVQLRQAPFIFWIHDLSVKDPYYVLPILMGFSMLIQQRLTPTSPDPTQAKMMMFLPVIFTVFFLNFPAGLTLYWLVNNCVQIAQQWYVAKTFEAHKAKKKNRAKNKKKGSLSNLLKK